MAKVYPFRGLRPKPELVQNVASLPYDVLDSDEARAKAQNNPNSFLHIIKPEIDLDPSISQYDSSVYEKGKENLQKFVRDGVLIQDDKPCYYVYTQIMGDHQQTGLVACASVEEYLQGIIKKHEHTQAVKVDDRIRLMQSLNAQTGPVFLTYRDQAELNNLLVQCTKSEPVYDMVGDFDVRHIFYKIDDPAMTEKIQKAFANTDYLYIADGHHRSEAASQMYQKQKETNPQDVEKKEYHSFLTVIFPESEMLILPYNRVVKNLNGLSEAEFLNKIEQNFIVTPVDDKFFKPSTPKTIGVYLSHKWYSLTLKEEDQTADTVASLDVSILQKYLFEPVLNIIDQRTDPRLKFVGGLDSVEKISNFVDSGQFAVAFSLYATKMEQIMEVADDGQVMPPKSTWFEPKLLSGLVTHLYEK